MSLTGYGEYPSPVPDNSHGIPFSRIGSMALVGWALAEKKLPPVVVAADGRTVCEKKPVHQRPGLRDGKRRFKISPLPEYRQFVDKLAPLLRCPQTGGNSGWPVTRCGAPRIRAHYIPCRKIIYMAERKVGTWTRQATSALRISHHAKDLLRQAEEPVLVLGAGLVSLIGTNVYFTHGFPSHYFNPTRFDTVGFPLPADGRSA